MKGTPAEAFLEDLLNDEAVGYVALFDYMVDSDVLKESGKGRPKKKHQILSRSMTADGQTNESEFLPPEHKEIKGECSTMRQSLQMKDGRILRLPLHGSQMRRNDCLSCLFPEVLKANVTSQTNTEKRPLFLVVGKDSYGKTFTVLHCFMTSEQKWIFQWLWETGIPILVQKRVLQ